MAVVMDPQMPTGTEVASYETYAQARAGVDFLSDAGFDVSAITIVGSDLHLVERLLPAVNRVRGHLGVVVTDAVGLRVGQRSNAQRADENLSAQA